MSLVCSLALLALDSPARSDAQPAAAVARAQDPNASTGDPLAALDAAQAQVRRARAPGRSPSERAEALERLSHAHLALEQYDRALPPVLEAVRIWRATLPVDEERLALALDTQATVLLALRRPADAEQALRAALDAWRRAYPPQDPRLVAILESQARAVGAALGRPLWQIELMQEALRIRQQTPGAPIEDRARAFTELATVQWQQGRFADSDASLAAADPLLVNESQRQPQRQDLRRQRADLLALRGSIALVVGAPDRAEDFYRQARSLVLDDRLQQAELQLRIAGTGAAVREAIGDLEGAVREQRQALAVFERHQDLLDDGSLDKALLGDTLVALARLHLARHETGPARQALRAARNGWGDTAEILFNLAELERLGGSVVQARDLHASALRLRQQGASEVVVQFGTNRSAQTGAEGGRFGNSVSTETLSLGRASVWVPEPAQRALADAARPGAARPPAGPVGLLSEGSSPALVGPLRMLEPAAFVAEARGATLPARKGSRSAWVLVPGAGVSFDEALRSAAGLSRSLLPDAPVFVFSWSGDARSARGAAPVDVTATDVESLRDFLALVERATSGARVHLMALGAGSRLLLPALAPAAAPTSAAPRLTGGELVLVEPSATPADWGRWLDAVARQAPGRITLYAGPVDRAMAVNARRAGGGFLGGRDANDQPLIHRAVQTIDLSAAALPVRLPLHHDRWLLGSALEQDVRSLLQSDRPASPERRSPQVKPVRDAATGRSWWVWDSAPDAPPDSASR